MTGSRRPRPLLVVLAVVAMIGAFINFGLVVGKVGSPIPLLVSHPLGMLGMAYLLFGLVFPAVMGGQSSEELAARINTLRISGPPLASGRISGQIGTVRMTWPLLGVQVYQAGLLLEPFLLPKYVILAEEITEVTVKSKPLTGRYSEVAFATPGVSSPLILYASPEGALARAIEQITVGRVSDVR